MNLVSRQWFPLEGEHQWVGYRLHKRWVRAEGRWRSASLPPSSISEIEGKIHNKDQLISEVWGSPPWRWIEGSFLKPGSTEKEDNWSFPENGEEVKGKQKLQAGELNVKTVSLHLCETVLLKARYMDSLWFSFLIHKMGIVIIVRIQS